MHILYLHSISGDPHGEHILLAPRDMAFPEDVANLVLRRVAETNKDITWDDVRQPLLDAGFVEPSKVIVNARPWDESRANNQMTFKVAFPSSAPHEHAGKFLIATNSLPFEDGAVVLIDEHKQILTAGDQLWDQKQKYIAQVPLGPVELPDSQFATPSECRRAARMLQASGYELANKMLPA